MGRDCHRLDGHGGGAICSSKSKRKVNAANGCMAAFYHLFDFQSLYFPSHHNLTIDSPSRSKGSDSSLLQHKLIFKYICWGFLDFEKDKWTCLRDY